MADIRKKINGRELSKFLKITDDLKNKDVEIIIRPVSNDKKRFAKIYSSPVKVGTINIQSRNERNEK